MSTKFQKYINREISWLQFNERVLQEAKDASTPLLERLIFLGIYSNNQDEFFRVRVATLNRILKIQEVHPSEDTEANPQKILKEIDQKIVVLQGEFYNTYQNIKNELAKENIHIIDETQLTSEQGIYVKKYFREEVRQHLFPIMLDQLYNFATLRDKSIYLAIDLKYSKQPEVENYALIEIPAYRISRFLILPSNGDNNKYILLLDDVIRYCLSDIFSIFGFDIYEAYTIKFTRDAELDIDNDVSKSFLEKISDSIKQRKKGATVRFIYDENIPLPLLNQLVKKFFIKKKDTLKKGGKYHNFKDFMNFPLNLGADNLRYEEVPKLYTKELSLSKRILDCIKKKDIMLHYPYQSFQYIIDLLREASIDPAVRAIKMTIYRAAKDSRVINALINAVRNGKEVTVYLELQARFDEEANIYWAGIMQEEGVKVIQNIPGYKVHCKLILIRRKENNENVYYAGIGTGNPNEITSKIYVDEHLLTANKKIVSDVNKVFHLFEAKYNQPDFDCLIVSPFKTRSFFIHQIDNEIRNAKKGKPAWIIIKLNNLVDDKIINKLYEASQANVNIKVIVRGICVLVPGLPGISENIEAISIVDRYLEHSRIFVFCNNDDNKYFIGSADWMQRNFDHRIEVTTPIYDKKIQADLNEMLKIQLKDNVKARIISANTPIEYKKTDSEEKIRSQIEIYKYLKNKQ
ncbi:MAG: polyphosphate kinase 1 [Bacteroidetes bacterium]|nr:polyphosphate kinase 1 [Bacteroidota bacterium]